MSAVSLYRAYRPQQFADVVGQEHVILALQEAIRSGKINHAYLFCGTRGTGKTSLAKIFARAINCLSEEANRSEPCNTCAICQAALDGSLLDIIEMDAASNNSVDSIRHIVEEVHFTPTQARYKVYIIDEAHMLSNGAFNALLKTLEEPPEHAVFILATTDPQRIPATILSRCQRYDLRALTPDEIYSRLEAVCKREGIQADPSALACLSQQARGALRDALSLLDQCRVRFAASFDREAVLELLGFAGDAAVLSWLEAFVRGDLETVLRLLQQFLLQGQDVGRLLTSWLQGLRNLLLCTLLSKPEELVEAPAEQIQALQQLAKCVSLGQIQGWIQEFSLCMQACKTSEQPRLVLETALIALCPLPASVGACPSPIQKSLPPTPEPSVSRPVPRSTAESAAPQSVAPVTAEVPAPSAPPASVPSPAEALPPEAATGAPSPAPSDLPARKPSEPAPSTPSQVANQTPVPPAESAQKQAEESPKASERGLEPRTAAERASTAEPRANETPAPAAAPVSAPAPAPTAATSTESAPMPNTKENPQNPLPSAESLWPKLLDWLRTNGAVILYLMLHNFPATFEGREIRLFFTSGQKDTYNIIHAPENQDKLQQALRVIGGESPLILTIETENLTPKSTRQTPTVGEIRDLAEQYNIPFEQN